MGKIILDMSMSLDGFISAPNHSPEEPLGTGGQRLQEWLADMGAYAEVLDQEVSGCGAVIMGRRTYDFSLEWWAGKGPVGDVPCFVLSHTVPEKVGSVFTFVTGGIESALKKARALAGEKSIGLMGANTQQQFIRAGLVDEIHINLVPVLLGAGIRLFEHLGTEPIELENIRVIESPGVTHLGFRVSK